MARPAPEHGLYAVVAEFNRPEALLEATKKARAEGFRRLEAFSPFPVEGLAKALDFRERRIAPLFLIGGIVGAAAGFGLQVYCNLDFPLNIGGRPVVAPPAFVLITFELMVLVSVTAGVVGMLLMNHLPRLNHPLFEIPDFHFATADKFFLAILAEGPGFDPDGARRFLAGLDPVRVAEAPAEERLR
jgi:hypothetical protein